MSTSAILVANFGQTTEDISVEKSLGQGPPPIVADGAFDPGNDGSDGEAGQPIGNAFLAMLLFLGADVMLFAGLIGAFVVFRYGVHDWPPTGQPRLPIGVTGVNTAILLYSGYTMIRAWRRLRNWNRAKVIQALAATAVLGSIFLIVQGHEWVRLLRFGLTLSSSVYGSMFYTLIGCHGLHVLGAVVWLLVVLLRLIFNPHSYGPGQHVGIKLIGMYWFLVVALWPVLYGLVYLS
jgi:heme/copper-type cytochrome/quinol oxidase subunit 3